ncbi:hypothetical protein NDU88_001141 [Pleurodeles waltl]|uniref:Uncharacterized protein n=1 Tax=Pleurodeles waltl TaxID=8319 RepID=A0AAV7VVL6_PLEWA|nr:hypothetical protein NDU88_001141 [Pleurodeles waltl]
MGKIAALEFAKLSSTLVLWDINKVSRKHSALASRANLPSLHPFSPSTFTFFLLPLPQNARGVDSTTDNAGNHTSQHSVGVAAVALPMLRGVFGYTARGSGGDCTSRPAGPYY